MENKDSRFMLGRVRALAVAAMAGAAGEVVKRGVEIAPPQARRAESPTALPPRSTGRPAVVQPGDSDGVSDLSPAALRALAAMPPEFRKALEHTCLMLLRGPSSPGDRSRPSVSPPARIANLRGCGLFRPGV